MPRLGAQYKGDRCKLGVFHPVIVGIYPVSQYRHGGSSSRWRKRRALILKMHDYCCVYCGDEANTVDHIIPINKGGTDDPLNLVAACGRCNYAFGDKTKHIDIRICDVLHSPHNEIMVQPMLGDA
jgi:5-methylcytosine-specific restriction endonuclease McrA